MNECVRVCVCVRVCIVSMSKDTADSEFELPYSSYHLDNLPETVRKWSSVVDVDLHDVHSLKVRQTCLDIKCSEVFPKG